MRYAGSKKRIAKTLAEIIQPRNGEVFVEPFCGGANITSEISGPRMASDIDNDLIVFWNAVSRGEFQPPSRITEEQYNELKNQREASALRTFAGFYYSFGGLKFASFAKDDESNDYARQANGSFAGQSPKLKGVEFKCCDYQSVAPPEGAVIYCDPPYTFKLDKYGRNFNPFDFWDWCREKSESHNVFVSEEIAPNDFVSIWEKPLSSKVSARNEKLYVHKSRLEIIQSRTHHHPCQLTQ